MKTTLRSFSTNALVYHVHQPALLSLMFKGFMYNGQVCALGAVPWGCKRILPHFLILKRLPNVSPGTNVRSGY